jgi:AcrR family transcriptional regulator
VLSGPPADPPEFGAAERRSRYAAAAAHVAHEVGCYEVTVAAIVEEAGGSRAAFHDVFSSPDDCLRQGLGEAHQRLFEPFRLAAVEGEWTARLDAAISGYLDAIVAESHLAELFILHCYAIEARDDGFMASAVEDVAGLLRQGHPLSSERGSPEPSPLFDECLARGVIVHPACKLRSGRSAELAADKDDVLALLAIYYSRAAGLS